MTITTLGYGEISPIHPFARILAASEAVIGVMYVAVLIGAIIGSYRNTRNN
ncbi:MAG: ion channel [Rhizobiaceae bacterium]